METLSLIPVASVLDTPAVAILGVNLAGLAFGANSMSVALIVGGVVAVAYLGAKAVFAPSFAR